MRSALSRSFLLSAAVLLGSSSCAHAAQLTWDIDAATSVATGGTGTWNTTNLFWFNGSSYVAWNNTTNANDDALFAGTAGTITVGTVTANSLTFNTTGYSLTGGTLTLAGSTPTISVGTGLTSTISSVLQGTAGLVKSGTGTLLLSGINTFTGGVSVNAGTVKIGNNRAFGPLNAAVGTVTVASGATVDFNGVADAVYGYTISGSGVGGAGALVNNGGAIDIGKAQTSNLRLAADATIGGTGEWGVLTGGYQATSVDLAGFTLTKTGTGSLHLTNTTFTAGSFNISSGSLFLNSFAASTSNLSAVALTLANTAGVTFTLNDKSLSVGSLAGGGATGGNIALGSGTLTVGNASSTTYSGAITGTGGLVKQGAGTLTLAGTNTFSGGITLSAGTLALGGAGRLNSGNYAGAIANSGILSIGTSQNQTLSGVISGTGSLNKSSSGVLTLSNANTFAGGVTLSGGAITLGNNAGLGTGTLTLAGGTLQTNGETKVVANNLSVQSSTTSSLTGDAAGDLLYTGSATGSGTINLNSTNSRSVWLQGDWSGFTGTINVTVNTDGTNYRLGGTPGATTGGNTTNTSDLSQARIVMSGSGTNRHLSWSGTTGSLVLIGELSGSGGRIDLGAFGRTANWSIGHLGTSSSFSGVLLGAGQALTKVGAGTLTLGGANTFTGGVTVSGGVLRIANKNALGSYLTGNPVTQVVVSSGATVDLNGVGDATYGYTISGAGVGGAGALVNNGGTITTFTAQTSKLLLAANATIGGTGEWGVLGAGFLPTSIDLAGFTLTKVGSGAFHLTNTTFTAGSLSIQGGTVFLNVVPENNGTNTSLVNLSLANAAGALFVLNDKSLTLASLSGGGASGGNVTLGTGTLTVGNASDTTYDGSISGTGAVVKQGSGTLTLTRANSFSGGLTVAAGIVRLGADAGFGGTTSTVGSGALTIQSGAAVTTLNGFAISGVSGAGNTRVVNLAGTLTLAETEYVRTFNLTGGSLVGPSTGTAYIRASGAGLFLNSLASANASTITGRVDLTFASLTVDTAEGAAANDLVISAVISQNSDAGSGNKTLTKVGSGTLSLTGANTYSGGTNLNSGSLEFASGSLGSSGTVTLAGGTLRWASGNTQDISSRLAFSGSSTLDTNGNNVSLASALSGGSSLTLTKSGSGTLALGGNSTGLSSAWSITAGTLKLDHVLALGTGNVTVLGGYLDLGGLNPTNLITLSGGNLLNFENWSPAEVVLTGNVDSNFINTLPASEVRVTAGSTVDLSGVTKDIVFEGGTLSNLSGYQGNLKVKTNLDLSSGGPSGEIEVAAGGTVNFGNAASSRTIKFAGGTITGQNFTGNVEIVGTGISLGSAIQAGTVRLTAGNSATITADFNRDITFAGGALSGLTNYNGTVSLETGATLTVDDTTGASFSLASGSKLKGEGTIDTIIQASGSILAPGNSPGLLTTTTFEAAGGAILEVEFFDPTGFAGLGYDAVSTTTLDLSDLDPANRYVLKLISLSGLPSTEGPLNDFDASQTYAFDVFTYATLILPASYSGGIADLFTIDLTRFQDQSGVFVTQGFTLSDTGTALVLNYAPIPEPSTYGLILGGLALAGAAVRRRKQKAAK